MEKLFLITLILSSITFNSLAQIQMESSNVKIPIISSKDTTLFSRTGPILVVKIDSFVYKLDSKSSYRLDRDWIKSITVLKNSDAKEIYGYTGEDGIAIIRLFKNHEEDFIYGKIATNPFKIKKVE